MAVAVSLRMILGSTLLELGSRLGSNYGRLGKNLHEPLRTAECSEMPIFIGFRCTSMVTHRRP